MEEAPRQPAGPARQASAAPVRAAAPQSAQPFTACGEQVVPAVGPIKAVVADINAEWHSDLRVYQSVQPFRIRTRM